MRTTYYHFIDGSVGIGTTYHTSNGTINEFGIGISSHIGIGTVNNVHAPFAIHHDGPASESNRTGGIEIVGNSNTSGDKHGARILAYNRVFYDQSDPPVAIKGFRRLRFQASEYQFETPSDNGTSTNNADPAVGITSLGNVGIGTTDTIDTFDGGFDRRLVVYGGGAQVGSAYTWTGGDFYHAEDIITAVTKSKSGGFAINCRDQEVSATDPSKPVWTLRSYSNEPIAFGQGLTEIARFDENGNLGIGTSTPSVKLDVIGSATVEGDLFLREVPSDAICKINANGNLNLFADAHVRFYESDNNKLMFTFDVNTTYDDARMYMEGDSDTYFNHPRDNQLGFTVGGNEVIRLRDGQVVYTPMTTAQRNALTAQTGGVIFNSSTSKLQVYNGSAWVDLH